MALTPETSINITSTTIRTEPNATQKLTYDVIDPITHKVITNGRISNTIDDRDAVIQAIIKILNTERGESPLYSADYGLQTQDLLGMPFQEVEALLPMRVSDALMVDGRVKEVKDFSIKKVDVDSVLVKFTVDTIVGKIDIEQEVSL